MGQKNGYHKHTYPSGAIYEGEWLNGQMDGKGKFTKPNGVVYEGEFWNGNAHGKGKYTAPNGDMYEGESEYGRLHKGKYTSSYGVVYEGQFRGSKANGKGKLISRIDKTEFDKIKSELDIQHLTDYISKSKQQNYENFYELVFEGIFHENKFQQGRLEIKDLFWYEGKWLNGKVHGQGTLFDCLKQKFEQKYYIDGMEMEPKKRETNEGNQYGYIPIREEGQPSDHISIQEEGQQLEEGQN